MTEYVVDISISVSELVNELEGLRSSVDIIRICHLESTGPDANILHLARKDKHARDVLVALAKLGFYAYTAKQGVTSFVFDGHISNLWHSIKNGSYSVDENGLVYSLARPKIEVSSPKLLVIFSSIGPDITNPGLIRYFTQNYQSVQKFVPATTAILRIADIGGVQGGFYLNTSFRPNNADHIASLIAKICLEHGIEKTSVVLYGASKGATGALYHGLMGKYRTVAVDPILSDEYYETHFDDSHFTRGGIFPQSKQDVFAQLIDRYLIEAEEFPESAHLSVITSSRSPQYEYVEKLLGDPLLHHVALFNTLNPRIDDHPDVSPNSLDLAVTLMNTFFYDLGLSPGIREVSFD
ncbi:XcbB/CpsF family capsular polysaccharide biosynthesis protein [Pseudarthrobacter sp. S9]|uniref:XcbB/CpsF family capsular polysaccharide biosynthesis protein n=1 Tax=Pseudarthrobacter sp. S9 TaxID=3418421 RepID=UPI003D00D2C3